jgi:hypothetical protein
MLKSVKLMFLNYKRINLPIETLCGLTEAANLKAGKLSETE